MKFINSLNLNRFSLLICFFFPFCNYLISLLLAYPVPYFGDFFLIILFSLFSLVNFLNLRLKKFDLLIYIYFLIVIFFIYTNFNFFDDLYKLAEIRYIIYIPILFFLFRITYTSKSISIETFNFLYLILKINLFICIGEFIIINFLPFSDVILNRALTVFANKERMYDSIFGNLYKPAGLFPGSGNASIAITILLIWAIKIKNPKWIFYFLILIGLIITFTFTSLIILIFGFLFVILKKIKFFNFNIILLILFILFYFSGQITNFRSSGLSNSELESVSFETATFVYQVSFEKYIEKFSFLPHKFSFSETNNLSDLIGPTGEIYLLRVGIYFGNLLVLIFVIWLFYLVFKIIKSKNGMSKILYFISFSIIISSFHYPAINGIPLYFLLPLSTVLGINIDSKSFDKTFS